MSELLNKISSDNLVLICVIMSIIALLLAVLISIELYINYRKRKTVINDTSKNDINIKEDASVTYVEEDDEFEKTQAKLELAKLKAMLQKEEEEKKKLLEINLALTKDKIVKEEQVSVVENNKENEEIEILGDEVEEPKPERVEKEATPISANTSQTKDEKISLYEELEEENAIISYDELKKTANFGYSDEEMSKYIDEKDAIISIDELERLYKESNEIKMEEFDIKRVEDLPKISDDKKFQSSQFISPVYGVGITEESILLEQTANLEKLNEEIKKTNEFLKTLKELKKNLQ